jgi:glucoselysine-6-phosphate deglycase
MRKSIMWNYINEEKEKLNKLLSNNQINELVEKNSFHNLNKIVLVASGSSFNIGTVARKLFEEVASVELKTYTPSDFHNSKNMIKKFKKEDTLIVAISQTGTSTGTITSVKMAKEMGFRVLTITERRNTPVEGLGDYYLNFLCDLEDCNAKSKGYSSSLTILILLAISIAKKKGLIDENEYLSYSSEIKDSINEIPETIKKAVNWVESHKDWATINHFLTIGYGMNYGSAVEGMLKILETLCIPASVCDIGEFSHGFHRTMTGNSNVITILTEEEGKEEMVKANKYLESKINKLLVINASKEEIDSDNYINIEYRPLTSSCINIAVVFQVIAVSLPEIIGHDPNEGINEDYTLLVNTRVK